MDDADSSADTFGYLNQCIFIYKKHGHTRRLQRAMDMAVLFVVEKREEE